MTNVNTHILNQMCIVHLEISAWSGRSRLDKSDFLDQSQLPPETAVSLGSKKLINDKIISRFHSLRSASHRACEKLGISFVGGYAIRVEDIENIDAQLTELKDQFQMAVADLVNNYQQLTEEWVRENPGFERQLRKALPSAENVGRRFSYDYSIFQIESTPTHDMHAKASKLFGRVLEEVANTARNYIETSLNGSTDKCSFITSRGRSILNTIQSRLRQLTFISSEFGQVADWVENLYHNLPAEGGISGEDYRQFATMLNTLANGERVMETAKLFAGAPKDTAREDLFMPAHSAGISSNIDEPHNIKRSIGYAQAEPSCDWGTNQSDSVTVEQKIDEPTATNGVEQSSMPGVVDGKPKVDETSVILEEETPYFQRVVGADFMPSIKQRKTKTAVSGEEVIVSKPTKRATSFFGIEAANF